MPTGRLTDTGTSLHLIAAEELIGTSKTGDYEVKNINATSQSLKNTALHLCAFRTYRACEALIRNGADSNALNVTIGVYVVFEREAREFHITFSCFNNVTQITEMALISLTHITRSLDY